MSSTTHTELHAARRAGEAVFEIRCLLQDMLFPVSEPVQLGIDNQAAIAQARGSGSPASMRHVEIDTYMIRDDIADEVIVPRFVRSVDNTADIFIKPLPATWQHKQTTAVVGLKPSLRFCAGSVPRVLPRAVRGSGRVGCGLGGLDRN